MSQPNAGPFTAICLEEDHTLILQGDPDGRYSSFGRARITFRRWTVTMDRQVHPASTAWDSPRSARPARN